MAKVNADLVDVERERDSLSSEVLSRKQDLEAMKELLEGQRGKERCNISITPTSSTDYV